MFTEPHGYAYQPLHSSVKPEDVEGATYAWDDDGAWRFAHCSPGEQRDYAARAETFAAAQFAKAIQVVTAAGALAHENGARNTHYQGRES